MSNPHRRAPVSRGRRWFGRLRHAAIVVTSAALAVGTSAVGAAAATNLARSPGWAVQQLVPGGGVASGVRAASSGPKDKIAPGLRRKFEQSGGQPQDFWVTFSAHADTSGARQINDWGARGRYVVDHLEQTAHQVQASTIAQLKAAGVHYQAFWIVDAIRVDRGSEPLAVSLAAQPGVHQVITPVKYKKPDPVKQKLTSSTAGTDGAAGTAVAAADAAAPVPWDLANIKADQVWQDYGVRGDGITVGSIDTGVQFDHPALVDSYRGNNGNGTFSNDYNWFDVSGKSPFPHDAIGHGTHTMGTMVGDDGGDNQIGVAPAAKWIEASGCSTCADNDLMASAQWMLAPTKVDGSSPDPAKRPQVINNSWGSTQPSTDPFLEDVEQAWADAGIFAAWSNGNNGPTCDTSGTPGDRTINYSVGAYDQANTIAPFSSRGPGQDGQIKPNISAPGVDVRSAFPGNQYALMSGTSMAAPHVAGSVALLWSADPSLIGNIPATRQLLDQTATDTPDSECGGTDADNDVYGQGRLDALALVQATSPTVTGTITGTITDSKAGTPVQGATVHLTAGDLQRSARAGSDGTYTTSVAAGEYQATITAFGYQAKTIPVTVTARQTTTTNITLDPVPGFRVTGKVADATTGHGIPGATITIADTPISATTGPDGTFTLTGVPGPRTYTVHIDGGGCSQHDVFRSVNVTGDTAIPTVELARKTDDTSVNGTGWGWGPPYGYSCITEPSQWIPADTPIEKPEFDHSTPVQLPFPFTYFGIRYNTLHATWGDTQTGANLSFWTADGTEHGPLQGGLMPFSETTTFDDQSQLLTHTSGIAPNRAFTVEFRDVTLIGVPSVRYSFEVTLHEDGDFVFDYKDIDSGNTFERGAMAIVGMTDHSPDGRAVDRTQLLYSVLEPVLDSGRQIHFSLPPNGFVDGTVVDRSTGKPVTGATVNAYDQDGTRVPVRTLTDAGGHYRLQLFTGQPYQVEVLKPPGYDTPPRQTVQLTTNRQVLDLETELHAGGLRANPGQLTLSAGDDPATIQLKNTGDTTLNWRTSTSIPEPDAPAPGAELSSTPLNQVFPGGGFLTGVEEADGDYWVSGVVAGADGSPAGRVIQVTSAGDPTGAAIDMPKVADALGVATGSVLAPGDMAWIGSRGWLCMSFFISVNDIACANPDSGDVTAVIPTGAGRDTSIQGLAYDEESDRFFVDIDNNNGGFQERIRAIAGVRHPDPGLPLNTCTFTRQAQGLAWNPTSQTLWTNTQTVLRQFDPATCAEISSLPAQHAGGLPTTGLDLKPDGDFVASMPFGLAISVTRSPDRIGQRLPWLSVSAAGGSLKPGGTQKLDVDVDRATIPDDVTHVFLVLHGNGGAQPEMTIPITLQR